MFGDSIFRKALDECLARMRQGETLEACLAAHPAQAEKLGPFLRAAAIMWKIEPPRPTAQAMAQARNKLLHAVEGGSGKEAAFMGVFRFAHVAAMAVATFFAASIGLVAAAGGGDFITAPFGGDDGEKFEARVVSTSERMMLVQREDAFVFLRLSDGTRLQDAEGHEIDWTRFHRNDRVRVRATHHAGRYFDAHLIRLIGDAPVQEPTRKPEATHEPERTKVPEPTPVETRKPEPTHVETPKPTPRETVKPAPVKTERPVVGCEFYGTVTAVAETHITVQTDGGAKTVWTSNTTQFPNGYPFVGVMVGLYGTMNDDGSCNAGTVKVKKIEFEGEVIAVDGNVFTISAGGHHKTVVANEHTAFPAGHPVVGDLVFVRAYIMGDGTFLAIEIKVKPYSTTTFEGVVVQNQTDAWTLVLNVSGTEKSICYEFASNRDEIKALGGGLVGKTVRIHTHPVRGEGYAELVEVLN